MEHYPDARLIHTMREPESWFESTQATIFSPDSPAAGAEGPFGEFFAIVSSGYQGRMHDRDFMIDYFRRHTDAVLEAAPKDRLLVYEASQGWESLCAFLDVPVPAAPFPCVNTTDEFRARFMAGGPPPGA